MQQALLSRAVASALFVIMTSVVTQPCAAATTTTIDENSQPLVKDSNTRLYGSITQSGNTVTLQGWPTADKYSLTIVGGFQNNKITEDGVDVQGNNLIIDLPKTEVNDYEFESASGGQQGLNPQRHESLTGALGRGNVVHNTLEVIKGSVRGFLAGGNTAVGNAESNRVFFEKSAVANLLPDNLDVNNMLIVGGSTRLGVAQENVIDFQGSFASTSGMVFTGGQTNKGDVLGNEVHLLLNGQKQTISLIEVVGGNIKELEFNEPTLEKTHGSAKNNVVEIKNANFDVKAINPANGLEAAWIVGGFVDQSLDADTEGLSAVANSVSIEDSVFHIYHKKKDSKEVHLISGGFSKQNVLDNQVRLRNVKVTFENASSTEPPLVIAGGVGTDNKTKVTNNRVTIEGNTVLDHSIILGSGLYQNDNGTYIPQDENNIISVSGTSSVTAIDGFDTLNLTFGSQNAQQAAQLADDTHAVLTLTYDEKTDTFVSQNLQANTQKTNVLSGRSVHIALAKGEKINPSHNYLFIKSNKDLLAQDATFTWQPSIFTQVVGTYTGADKNDQILSLNDFRLQQKAGDHSKTLAESAIASAAFVNQGAEFIVDEGLALIEENAKTDRPATFGSIRGGSTRYETGSHVNLKGVSLAAGVAGKINRADVGAFVESGWGSSDISVDAASADGDQDYYGVGVAARNWLTDKVYADASLRAGWAKTKFDGSFDGAQATYDASSLYATAHIGLGYRYQLASSWSADAYARYLFSYLDGDDADLHADASTFHMDSITSHAVRIGWRVIGKTSETASWRAGIAYEHVFDGKAKSNVETSFGFVSLQEPSLAGNTGILELGTTLTPSSLSPWSFDFGLKGYVGDRRGVIGNGTVLYRF